ncbi:MAG: RDD family protein [Moheibacter sp.]
MDYLSRAVEYSTASSGLRFANFIVDNILYAIVSNIIQAFLLFVLIPNSNLGDSDPVFIIFWILFSIFFVTMFYAVQEYLFKGRTIRKFVTGTRAVTLDGEEPDFKRYFIRSLCRIIPFEPFSFLFSASGWHDTISKTRVVKVTDFERIRSREDNIDQIGSAAAA